MLRRARLLLWLLVGLAAVLALLFYARAERDAPVASAAIGNVGGPFTLTAGDGKRFGTQQLVGRPYALFFGFTHCPDVCPTTLARLVKLRRQLPQGDKAFEILFVSVDPERDTPAELGRYAGLFDAPVIGLTGSAGEIERVKKLFGIYSAKVAQPGGAYSIDHSAAVLLFGRDGKFVATIAPDEGDGPALAKLRRISA